MIKEIKQFFCNHSFKCVFQNSKPFSLKHKGKIEEGELLTYYVKCFKCGAARKYSKINWKRRTT